VSARREQHLSQLGRALHAEHEEERARFAEAAAKLSLDELEARGFALCDVVARDVRGGVGSRRLITFERERGELGSTRLTSGAPVRATRRKTRTDDDPRGVVIRLTRKQLTVAFDAESPDWLEEGNVCLELLSDDTSYQRVMSGLARAEKASGRYDALLEALLAERPPRFDRTLAPDADDVGDAFNLPQREAITLALTAQDVALVHGPPGTGKTTVLVEIARLAVARGERVLACAASNAAVDLLAGRIAATGARVVRLGHPARVEEALQHLTLEAQIEAHDRYKVGRALVAEAMRLLATARKLQARGRGADRFAEARQARFDAGKLFREAREHEAIAERDVLERAQVIAATVTVDPRRLGSERFDLVMMDEATQASEPLALLAAERAERLVLAGDPMQLPPTILSGEAIKLGLQVSLFERLVKELPAPARRMLEIQHRMHGQIAAFPSERFYEGKLLAHPSVATHLLRELPGVRDEPRTATPLYFLDTAGTGHDEETPPGSESKRNPGEAALLRDEVHALLAAGLRPDQLAVIAPYEAQVRLLRELLPFEELEVDTVDAFQGREKEAVLVSLVRSNPDGELGFLADVRRMNVAITRARRRLWVVGDSATIASHAFYAAFLEAVGKHGSHVSAWEL
jgi:ATP-dependent RNA/DNA helicase IGHMBP2